MAFTKKSYEEIRDQILSHITKGIVNEKHVYESSRSKYKLSYSPVRKIVKVEGLFNGDRHVFRGDLDYRLSEDMVEWLPGGDKPDDMSPFYVNYMVGKASEITDINPGSVIRTIVESISREIDYLYLQLNQVYLSGFIDTASGSALDLVVSILGVERKPAEPASGKVTFGRNSDPGEVNVTSEAHMFDGKMRYPLKNHPVKKIVKVEGNADGNLKVFQEDVDYILSDDNLVWLEKGVKPDPNTVFYIDYIAYERIEIPAGVKISTYARRPEDIKTYVTTESRFLKKVSTGKWEADVPVKALAPGRVGNVYAGAITVMPQPLVGVEYVINRQDILNGADEETDDELRHRAKKALEVAGKATLISLDSAVRGVEGVSSVRIEDMPEGVPGLVKIIVDGGDTETIKNVIEDVRAAGIKVEFLRPKPVYIDVSLTLVIYRGYDSSRIVSNVESKIRSYVSSLDIGDDVIYSRLVGAALAVKGVYDVNDLTVKAYHVGVEEAIISDRENISVSSDERAAIRMVNIVFKFLSRGGK